MDIYHITEPTAPKVPIIISSPHSGTYFPQEIASRLTPQMAQTPDDADWFIDRLYDFAPQMGITLIKANYCRWVIDLNRDPESKPLYTDGRVITGLVPLTNFNGDPLYVTGEPDASEIAERVHKYYLPYHEKIEELIEQTVSQFGVALLFDAHSIRRVVPGIRPEPFPQLILGDNDGTSASAEIINTAWQVLQNSGYEAEHNHPFKGGHITRYFGKPKKNVHALQLEMAKTNYMDATETKYDDANATAMRGVLADMFTQLIKTLQ
ncbi:N-formylglutamate amidohydrolase [Flavobacterium subsaxonicum]|uniref:N-formylglutamate deformylase n=1 Tax=Flavobacterium subsaxonicum WB 4.1-42 = DSM 21790 TaxID=1121898 RepID=A0A0A2MKJ2_9FLAO|nr:N-formylglutamate amidohydrolase [Flavobacterium subsaxonicum]KGO92096.1 N-formylglutamate deformylase [Flavobacterium subsaxonicum WB 4.1-42 = DSM 21790]